MVGDPISDFIIQLKNATRVQKESVTVPYSKLKHAVAEKLEQRGYITSVEKKGKKVRKYLEIVLKYEKGGVSRLEDVARVSKPGRRIYMSVSDIRPIRFGKGALILSTPKGILTGEEARKEHVGGEALFKIW